MRPPAPLRVALLLARMCVMAACLYPACLLSEQPPPLDTPTFKVTGLPKDRALRILVYGDMRFTDPRNTSDTSPRVRKWLAEKVAGEKADAMLVTGDVPFRGSDPADWEVFHQEAASWQTQHLRVYPTIGNHEAFPDAREGRRLYYKNFPQVEDHPYYSVVIGNVLVITLDSIEELWPKGPQADWLRAQLDHVPRGIDFIFFLAHVPLIADVQSEFIASIPSPAMVVLRRYLEARALTAPQKFIMLNGHIHSYERFEVNGVTHIISGGGGAKPYPVLLRGPQDQYHDAGFPVFNYLIFTIHGGHADAKMYKVADPSASVLSVEVKDVFTEDAR